MLNLTNRGNPEMKDAKVDREKGGQVKLERFIEAEKSTVRKKKK